MHPALEERHLASFMLLASYVVSAEHCFIEHSGQTEGVFDVCFFGNPTELVTHGEGYFGFEYLLLLLGGGHTFIVSITHQRVNTGDYVS